MSINPVSSGNQSTSSMPTKMSQIRHDFKALKDSLNSGDLDGAQKAFAAFRQDVGKSRGRHLHREDNDTDATLDSTGTDLATTGTTGPASSAPDSTSFTFSSTSITLTLSLTLINISGTTSTTNPTGSLVDFTA